MAYNFQPRERTEKPEVRFVAPKKFWAESSGLDNLARVNPQFGEVIRGFDSGWNQYGVVRAYDFPVNVRRPEGMPVMKFYVWSGEFSGSLFGGNKFETGLIEVKDKSKTIPDEGEAVFGVLVPYSDNIFYELSSSLKPGASTEAEFLKECLVQVFQEPELNKAKSSMISDRKFDRKFIREGKHFSYIGAEFKPAREERGQVAYQLSDRGDLSGVIPSMVSEDSVYYAPEEEFVRKSIDRDSVFLSIYKELRLKMYEAARGEGVSALQLPKPDVKEPIIVETFHVNPESGESYVTYNAIQEGKYLDKKGNDKSSRKGVSLISSIPVQKMTELGEGGGLQFQMYVLLDKVKGRLSSADYDPKHPFDIASDVVRDLGSDVDNFYTLFEGGN